MTSFDGKRYVNQGPQLLSRTYEKFHAAPKDRNDFYLNSGFWALHSDFCYIVQFKDAKMFYEPWPEVLDTMKNSYFSHVWKRNDSLKMLTDSSIAYVLLAKNYCPKTFEASGEWF